MRCSYILFLFGLCGKAGQIALILGDIIFVHGGITPSSLGWLPPHTPNISSIATSPGEAGGYVVTDLHVWVEYINAFATAEMQAYVSDTAAYLESLEDESMCGTIHLPCNMFHVLLYPPFPHFLLITLTSNRQ